MRAGSNVWLAVCAVALGACNEAPGSDPTPDPAADAACPAEAPTDAGAAAPPMDDLSATRRYRRVTLALTNRLPELDRLEELLRLDAAAQDAWLSAEVERLMADPRFYDTMYEFARSWMAIPYVANEADAPEYGMLQRTFIGQCDEGTLHAGRWAFINAYAPEPCNGLDTDGVGSAIVRTVEPWWAEGTTIEVVGQAGDERPMVGAVDCGAALGWGPYADHRGHAAGCGCGPNLAYCYPSIAERAWTWEPYISWNAQGSRRLAQEEPMRLFAHIVWHDRPLTDLIAGTYTVGPREVQALYARSGRRMGAADVDVWWRTSRWTSPHDPRHDATDPWAWSEFEVSTRNPFLLGDRSYHFDPRAETSGLLGVPSAGVLTSPGFMGAHTRERVRGSRALEMFACENFVPPPASAHFDPYVNDPAGGGPCVHCHSRIDPASIHFRRFMRVGMSGYPILGAGYAHYDGWDVDEYPFLGDPWERMRRLWVPGTRMTPVDADIAAANAESRFIDFLPPDQTLYGQVSDGTVGPLGFSKMIIGAGRFDRCMARRLHQRVVGRDVDPATESGYLDTLASEFVAGDRQVRPFVRHLVTTDAFGRGL